MTMFYVSGKFTFIFNDEACDRKRTLAPVLVYKRPM